MSGQVTSVIVKLTARCNLNCSYCYVYNHEDHSYKRRPALMSAATFDAVLDAIAQYCGHHESKMSITFHGGEPTLVGAPQFDQLATRAASYLGSHLAGMSLQTNATLLDERWVDVLLKHDVSVGVSLDGPRETNDRVRLDHSGRGSYDRITRGLQTLLVAGIDPAVLCVVSPGELGICSYQTFRSIGVQRISFLLPDVSHDNKARLYGAFGDTPVADYLIPVFDAWFDEEDPAVHVAPFWGLLRMMFGGAGETDAFGNLAMGYLVVETDGAIEALDALRVCEDGIANSGLNVLNHGFDDLATGVPLVEQAVNRGLPLPGACGSCVERDICGGGYLPHRYSKARGFDNPSVWCRDILQLLRHMRSRVDQVIENSRASPRPAPASSGTRST